MIFFPISSSNPILYATFTKGFNTNQFSSPRIPRVILGHVVLYHALQNENVLLVLGVTLENHDFPHAHNVNNLYLVFLFLLPLLFKLSRHDIEFVLLLNVLDVLLQVLKIRGEGCARAK